MALPSVDLPEIRSRVEHLAVRWPRRLIALAAVLAALIGGVCGGPVAALAGGVYGALAARAVAGAIGKRHQAAARSRDLDDLCALAADLRAGLPPAAAAEAGHGRSSRVASAAEAGHGGSSRVASAAEAGHGGSSRVAELTAAVWRLAEQTGAPAAELVERIEADARAADRAKASAAAQAAGAQATALLLAALPLGGIALGYGIGADPLQVLLHTPLGAACATGAVLLQCGGLFWSGRLTNAAVR